MSQKLTDEGELTEDDVRQLQLESLAEDQMTVDTKLAAKATIKGDTND